VRRGHARARSRAAFGRRGIAVERLAVKRLVVAGNDKIGRAIAQRVGGLPGVTVVLDASTDVQRVLRLLVRRRMPVRALALMAIAEWRRHDTPLPHAVLVRTNTELLARAHAAEAAEIYLFRAGLIINNTVLASGIPVFNLHCAALPAYGGVAAIWRALRDGACNQAATLHRVTPAIDGGDVLAVEPYHLDMEGRYWQNEEIAYAAGERLLLRMLNDQR
jgi:hypothetical protein